MAEQKSPSFMRGTFVWSMYDFFYAEPPPMDLLDSHALDSDNPWIVIAAAVEHAKRRNHNHICQLSQWFFAGDEGYPDQTCILLTGDVGIEADLQTLLPVMQQGPDPLRAYACQAAAMAGRLWLVPFMLDAYKRTTGGGDRETIGFAISTLLEDLGGPIAEKVGSHARDPAAVARIMSPVLREIAERLATAKQVPSDFEMLVQERFNELREQFGTDQVAIWQGGLFSVPRLAERIYALVHNANSELPPAPYVTLRHKFEGATGINCTSWFRNSVFQPLAAADILETFLESTQATTYQEGLRYFFGHRIPD